MKRYIETGTVDHLLAVDAEPQKPDGIWPGWVNITQFEGSCRHGKYLPLRYRFRDAWRALRGEGRTWEEFYEAEGLDRLIAALREARQAAFGAEVATDTTQAGLDGSAPVPGRSRSIAEGEA